MTDAPFGLSDKEREVLRLLTHGHDVKSAAASLGLSVHTVTERLRDARSKTGASSSRGAARLLAECEHPGKAVPTQSGVRSPGGVADQPIPPPVAATDGSRSPSRWEFYVMMSLLVAVGLFGGAEKQAAPSTPHVVATSPVSGQTIAPGPIVLRVTFDRPMRAQSYSFVQRHRDTYPDCGATAPVQSADGRTFTLHCRTRPVRHYEVWFNDPRYMGFMDRDGVPAVLFGLRFHTGTATPGYPAVR